MRSHKPLQILLMLFVIAMIAPNASAQDSCARVKTCSSFRQSFDAAVGACQAEVRANHCEQAIPEMKTFVRKCTAEEACEDAANRFRADKVIPGCTGLTKEALHRMMNDGAKCAVDMVCVAQSAYAVAKDTVSTLFEMGHTVLHPIQSYNDYTSAHAVYDRAMACYNQEYRLKLKCEYYGGVFKRVATVYGVGKLASSVVRGAGAEASAVTRLQTRQSVLAERELAGRGVRPSAISQIRRQASGAAGLTAAKAAGDASKKNSNIESTSSARAASEGSSKTIVDASEDLDRKNYIRSQLGKQNTSVAERKAYEALALKGKSAGGEVFLDLQNSKMKYLNDTLGDKNVVTAITNRRLELMFDDLKALRAKYPGLKELSYDDFKSGRKGFSFADGKIPPGFTADVDKIMKQSEASFISEIQRVGVVPESVDLQGTFTAGKGATADQANVASRYAARTGQTSVNFWDPVVKQNLEKRLAATDTYRAGLMTSLKKTSLVEKLPNGEYIPTADVFEAYRKTTNASDLAKVIQERTGVAVPAQQAANIRNYLKQLDEWSTGLLITDARKSVTFAGSAYNGVTIDISGMGALNMRELSRSMIGVRDLDQALAGARSAERSATETFEANKQHIVDAARSSLEKRGIQSEIRVSGDDIIVLPKNKALDPEALESLHEAIAKSPSSSNVRLSAVDSGVAKADLRAVAGETLEKKVRGLSLQSVPDQSNYTLMVVSDASGAPVLKVAARKGTVSPEVEKAFQDALQKAREKN